MSASRRLVRGLSSSIVHTLLQIASSSLMTFACIAIGADDPPRAPQRVAARRLPDRGPDTPETLAETYRERNGSVFVDWPRPKAVLVVTGELDGYMEPCGCSGKENQKGGLSRRQNLLRALDASGWPTVAVDLGNQVRRFGRQSEVKFQAIADGLRAMGYSSVGFGPDDLRLPAEEIVAAVAAVGDRQTPFVSANVGLLGIDAGITPRIRIVESGGVRIGITSVLGDGLAEAIRNDSLEIRPATQAITEITAMLAKAQCDHQVLLCFAAPEETREIAARFPQFDIVVTAGTADEPPLIAPPLAAGRGRLIELGHKGMYAVAVGFFPGESIPVRTQRVPLDGRWGESEDMIRLLGTYQLQLETLGLRGLEIGEARHATGRRFAGSTVCADCHARAHERWLETPHATALETLEKADPRRDHDPECLSCHVVGWMPQKFEPYMGGFESREATPHLAHQGCENCHGPAAAHVAVESGDVSANDVDRDRLREELAMTIDTPEGRQKTINNCLECHDLDNSPSFDFDEYWPSVEHSEAAPKAPE